ncbi:DUF1987 domain-containing protein [Tunicatimonas pelagia]|uniref:DUF1987 domain-containing protein n=1 Tax=Tunicatimonas pelagia TaxID=931531 RepID=UPI00266503FE|nr:DUF1987 domain-containing protein [Tunicatimonas pelagia]WKN45589.1 DUF1987 domain-containing protein [Tunicatimonas pelagia]
MSNSTLDVLEIKGEKDTFYTPHVYFDPHKGYCLLEGESYLENTWEFYEHLCSWLREYTKTQKPLTFDFKMIYFNTSSSKGILEIMLLLKDYEDRGGEVKINWYYPEEDDDILEEAEDFIEDTQLDIELIPQPEE